MDEHDFKPILAEIQDKPVNPLGRRVLWVILILLILAMLGLYFVKVDVVVSAKGKVIPDGDVKVLQSFETGVVRKILVKEGDYVKKGQVLVEIDPTIEAADIQGKEKNYNYLNLSEKRVEALLTGKPFEVSENDPQSLLQRELYRSQKQAYESSLKQKEKQMEETSSAMLSLKDEVKSLERLLSISSEEEKRLKALAEAGAVAEARYRDKVKERLNLEKEIGVKSSQIEESAIRLEELRQEIEAIRSGFAEKLLEEAGSGAQQENLLKSEITTAKFKESKRLLTSPVDGYVHLIAIKTSGGVVTPGQPIISIVPEDTPLVVKAMVLNKDIGFVKEEQKVVLKIDTYDFQKYGTIKGFVSVVSPDSIEDKELKVDGYPVYVKMNSTQLQTKEGKVYKIKPGMNVLAEINIGKRRIIELFLSPFIKNIDEGLKVR